MGSRRHRLEYRRCGLRPAARRRLCRICGGQCRLLLPVPHALDLVDAAACPKPLFTAWTNIMDTGRLKPGETLLIHGGTSGIGSLAIQMFAARGHAVFATAGSDEKCEACKSLGASARDQLQTEDFVAVVKAQTGGKGVDVILDMVGGAYVQRNIEAAALWGRIVNIAYQDGARVELNLTPVADEAADPGRHHLARPRPQTRKAPSGTPCWSEVWPMVGTAASGPWWTGYFPWPRPRKPMNSWPKNRPIGKILLKFRHEKPLAPRLRRLKNRIPRN